MSRERESGGYTIASTFKKPTCFTIPNYSRAAVRTKSSPGSSRPYLSLIQSATGVFQKLPGVFPPLGAP